MLLDAMELQLFHTQFDYTIKVLECLFYFLLEILCTEGKKTYGIFKEEAILSISSHKTCLP